MIRWMVRVGAVFFWISIIALFLIAPYYYNQIRSSRTLNIFIWSNLLDVQYFNDFEKETGIRLNFSYYESNEELLSKLSATKGLGYDLIVPSDYTVRFLIEQDMLKPLDKSRLNFMHKLNPKVINNYSDPGNQYSIPYLWGMYGVGIDMAMYQGKDVPQSMALIFDTRLIVDRVGMPGDAREIVMMAAQYLFGDVKAVYDIQKREAVKKLLIEQKKYVSSYADERAEYAILSRMCSAILMLNPDMIRAQKERDTIQFIVPKEGVFVVTDNFVIPKSTHKDEMIYTFLNYLYQDAAIEYHCERFCACSPTILPLGSAAEEFCPVLNSSQKLLFFEQLIPEDILNDIWMALMAA